MATNDLSVLLLGATGAVGSHVARTCAQMPDVSKLTLLGRRRLEGVSHEEVDQVEVDIFDPQSYATVLRGHRAAICTLGVGQPSKVSREDFLQIDKIAVRNFATSCRSAGVRHFQLLGSIGADAHSRSFYLRTKGELEEELKALGFERLSLFQPSMILTPTNRYGATQALALAIWPWLNPILVGGMRRYRGIAVDRLGRAIALNLRKDASGVEVLRWDAIEGLAEGDIETE